MRVEHTPSWGNQSCTAYLAQLVTNLFTAASVGVLEVLQVLLSEERVRHLLVDHGDNDLRPEFIFQSSVLQKSGQTCSDPRHFSSNTRTSCRVLLLAALL